jgi:hypothetical protein
VPPGGRGNAISAAAATPGYLPGRIERGRWQVILGPYTVAPQGLSYTVSGTLRFGRPGTDVHALELAGAGNHDRDAGTLLDPTARAAYRRIPAELTAAARAAGLDFIISTEHNTLSASLQWGEHAGADLLIVNGEEVTTPVRTLAGVEPSGGQVDRLALPGGRPPGAAPVRRRGAPGRWTCRRCASVRVVLGLLVGVRLRAGRLGRGVERTVDARRRGRGTSVRLLDQSGPQWIQPVDATDSATVRWTTQTRYSRWVRAEVRRPVATATSY